MRRLTSPDSDREDDRTIRQLVSCQSVSQSAVRAQRDNKDVCAIVRGAIEGSL